MLGGGGECARRVFHSQFAPNFANFTAAAAGTRAGLVCRRGRASCACARLWPNLVLDGDAPARCLHQPRRRGRPAAAARAVPLAAGRPQLLAASARHRGVCLGRGCMVGCAARRGAARGARANRSAHARGRHAHPRGEPHLLRAGGRRRMGAVRAVPALARAAAGTAPLGAAHATRSHAARRRRGALGGARAASAADAAAWGGASDSAWGADSLDDARATRDAHGRAAHFRHFALWLCAPCGCGGGHHGGRGVAFGAAAGSGERE